MWRPTLFFRNLYLRITVTFLRILYKITRPAPVAKHRHSILKIPSRDPHRTITAHLYKRDTPSPSIPQPALINFHGSGFIFPAFGSDDEFCHHICQNTDYAVIDVQYRLSPENPFPAAVNDAEDVTRWVLGQPDKYDLTRLSTSGFSSGGNLAIVTAGALLPPNTFRSVLAFYAGVDWVKEPAEKIAPDTSGKVIPPRIARFFRDCYVPVDVDPRDPRISPCYGDLARFPARLLMITAARDNLAPEAEEFVSRVKEQGERHVVLQRMEHCDHGWDKLVKLGPAQVAAKERAYSMAVDMLRG